MTAEHEITIRVRYKETDGQGVLHHANYATYFEMGRVELLRANGVSYRDVEQQGLLMVIVKLECRFRRPAFYDDLLTLRTKTTRITAAKIEHTYELSREGQLLAEGCTTLACVDRQGNVLRVPEWLRSSE